jgi:ribonuclease Z
MEIVLLGTSAALPTQSRWPTATAILRGGEILLFDCGEGTQIQFQKAQLKPGKLSRIFISHFHGDHLYGLIGLLTSLQLAGREKPLYLYGPDGLARYLTFMEKLSQFKFHYEIKITEAAAERAVWEMAEYTVTAMPLRHSVLVLGFRLQEKMRPGEFDVVTAERLGIPPGPLRRRLQQGEPATLPNGAVVRPEQVLGPPRPGRVVALCLDTRPCPNSVELARKADVLIHEATFDAPQQTLAEHAGHSTAAEAAEIAKQAGAKKLILTHISARYGEAECARLAQQAQAIFPNTILGRDLQRFVV